MWQESGRIQLTRNKQELSRESDGQPLRRSNYAEQGVLYALNKMGVSDLHDGVPSQVKFRPPSSPVDLVVRRDPARRHADQQLSVTPPRVTVF